MKFEFFADAVDTPPTRPKNPSVGYPSNGDPATGRPATTPGAWFYYMLMVEFETLLKQNGIKPSATNLHQLADFFAAYKEIVLNASSAAVASKEAAQDAARTAAADAAAKLGASVVQTLAQSLSDAQKTQARKNIGIEGDGGRLKLSIMPDGVAYVGVANNAAAHNSIYRGADITSRHADGSLSTQVQAGDFTDIFIGDYITATTTANDSTVTTKWRVADIDYYLRCGDTETTAHHLVLVPDVCLFNAYMNSSNTTSGGYQGSAMWKTYIPMCVTAIRNAFGSSHVLSWRTILSKAVNTNAASMAGAGWAGAASDWAFCDASADLMSEPQLYGTTVFSSSSFDVGVKKRQFALFRHDPALMNIRAGFWLSAVSSGTSFAFCTGNGLAGHWGASNVSGVRPHFLYH